MNALEILVVGVLLAIWLLVMAPAALEPVVEARVNRPGGRPEDDPPIG